MTEHPDIEARAVRDARDFPLLFDLWVNGKWIGSRRTVEQCEQALSHYCRRPAAPGSGRGDCGVPVGATFGSPW